MESSRRRRKRLWKGAMQINQVAFYSRTGFEAKFLATKESCAVQKYSELIILDGHKRLKYQTWQIIRLQTLDN